MRNQFKGSQTYKIHQHLRVKSKHLYLKMNIVTVVCVCESGREGSCSKLVPPGFGQRRMGEMEDGEMFQGGAGRGKMNGWEEEQRLLLT